MRALRSLARRVLPRPVIDRYRRRRVLRSYLRSLAVELDLRQSGLRLEDLEERVAGGRTGFYEGLVKDVLDRTDLVLQELDRKIEGLAARHGTRLRALQEEMAALRASVEALRRSVPPAGPGPKAPPGEPGGGPGEAAAGRGAGD